MIKKYKIFNEGINQYLKGPTEEEVINGLTDKPDKLLNVGCSNGMLNAVKSAIELGAKPTFEHLKNAIGSTENEELLNILINSNNLSETDIGRLLMFCVNKDNSVMIKKIVDMGANIKSGNNAALRICSGLGKYNIAELLIKLGAVADEDMVYLAESHFYDDVAELLKKHIK